LPERCSVVICTRDRPSLLGDALDATLPTLRAGDELLVVDSASSTTDTHDVAQRRGVRVVRADRKGLSRARNLGAGATTNDVIVFTDDDCRPQPGWADHLAAPFDASEVGFVLGQVRADVETPHLPFDAARPRPRARFAGPTDPIELGNGACMAFRRRAWEACGGADERLGAGTRLRSAEDHDLFWRLLHHGWTGAGAPAALVLHRDWRTHREVVLYNWGVGLGTGAMVAKLWRVADASTVRPLLRRRLLKDGVAERSRWATLRVSSATPSLSKRRRSSGRTVVVSATRHSLPTMAPVPRPTPQL